jgi:3-methyl-2-oxobutanoate hydroxymethyltransferase
MSKSHKPLRIPDIQARKAAGEKITMLTAYDAWMARLLAASGCIDMLLVGDSLGMVELGYETTIPVTMTDMLRHTRAVRAGAPDSIVIADMPFLSYNVSPGQALRNAGRLLQQGGATAVKMEGGAAVIPAVELLVSAGVPVMGHLGLQPQSVHRLGGFRRQAIVPEEQDRLFADAAALQDAGAFAIVIECVPDTVAAQAARTLRVPIIGIGSGAGCDGQVLVTHDLLGLTGANTPPFVKRYAALGQAISDAAAAYADEVRSGEFPAPARRQAGIA